MLNLKVYKTCVVANIRCGDMVQFANQCLWICEISFYIYHRQLSPSHKRHLNFLAKISLNCICNWKFVRFFCGVHISVKCTKFIVILLRAVFAHNFSANMCGHKRTYTTLNWRPRVREHFAWRPTAAIEAMCQTAFTSHFIATAAAVLPTTTPNHHH